MKKAIKWTLISVGGLFGFFLVLGIVLAATGQTHPADTAAAKPTTVVTTEAPKPVVKTEAPKKVTTPKPTQKVTPKATPKPKKTTAAPVDRQAVFLAVMRNEYPQLEVVEDKTIVDAGKNVCTLYKGGYSTIQVVTVIINSGIEARMAGYLVGASTVAFCPKYSPSANAG